MQHLTQQQSSSIFMQNFGISTTYIARFEKQLRALLCAAVVVSFSVSCAAQSTVNNEAEKSATSAQSQPGSTKTLKFDPLPPRVATAPENESDDEKAVRARVEARWAALVNGEPAIAYTFFSPARRTTLSQEGFVANYKKDLLQSAKVGTVKCKDDLCQANILTETQIRMKNAGRMKHTTEISESWVRSENQWWYVPGR
jgi:hypothetical protein